MFPYKISKQRTFPSTGEIALPKKANALQRVIQLRPIPMEKDSSEKITDTESEHKASGSGVVPSEDESEPK
ncbi:hypothetical protein BC938DRAFT_483730, partial [Jimgerdemannia flammicorona]